MDDTNYLIFKEGPGHFRIEVDPRDWAVESGNARKAGVVDWTPLSGTDARFMGVVAGYRNGRFKTCISDGDANAIELFFKDNSDPGKNLMILSCTLDLLMISNS